MSGRWLIPIILVVAVLGLVVFVLRPSSVAERAAKRLGEVETGTFTAQLGLQNNITTQQLLGEQGEVEIIIDGSFDRSVTPPNVDTDVDLNIKTESVTVQVELAARAIADKVYLFVKKSPHVFPPLVQLKNQWVVFDRGGLVESASPIVDERLFTSVDRAGRETINGVPTIRYEAVASKAAVVSMMNAIAQILGTQLSAGQIADIEKSLNEVTSVPVTIWITRWGIDIQQIAATLTVPSGNTIRFTLTIKDRNKPVTIATPEGAVSLQQAVKNSSGQLR